MDGMTSTGPASREGFGLSGPLGEYFARNNRREPRYAGQASRAFQQYLADHHADLTAAECEFYHTVELPDGTVLPGDWDLRDAEPAYLGHVPIAGKRVLEYGPASGWLSAHIAARATLTVIDLPFGRAPELVPHPAIDRRLTEADAAESVRRLRNSWWYVRDRLRFDARAHYADIYDLPPDIGRHDVTVFGAILLHLSRPFHALEQAAAVTEEIIVVTDVDSAPQHPGYDALAAGSPGLTAFNPTEPPFGMTHWWALSPALVAHMLRRLGFGEITTTRHSPPRMASQPAMFTVVGRRTAAAHG